MPSWTHYRSCQVGVSRSTGTHIGSVHRYSRCSHPRTASPRDGLYDRSVNVRRFAQQVAGFDAGRLGELYRGALTQPDRREVALHGLADIGDAREAAAATESLTDPRARVRAAPTRLLATSGAPATGDVLVGLVSDPSSRVATEAIRGLLARGLSERIADQLFDAAASGPESVRRRVFRRALPHTSKWWQLRYGLHRAAPAGAARAPGKPRCVDTAPYSAPPRRSLHPLPLPLLRATLPGVPRRAAVDA